METTWQRQQSMSRRMYERNLPSQPLQPYLDARPVMSKYTWLPTVEQRVPSVAPVPLRQQPTFQPSHMFNPGNDGGPWSGFASNVNRESDLRNQLFALQSCDQAAFVPSSRSSLYVWPQQQQQKEQQQQQQPFSRLFESPSFAPFNPNLHADKVGFALFNNATRQQIKEV